MTLRAANPFGDVFGTDAVTPEVAAHNARMGAMLSGRPGLWDLGLDKARGGAFMPAAPRSARALERVLDNGIRLRVLPAQSPRGIYLHIHGGGFVLGSAAGQDPMLERIVERVGVTCVSVDYRLAPEHPYPGAWDDCEAAALWLARNGAAEFGSGRLLVGGESAGALLTAATLVRMRDRHDYRDFLGANLCFGVYDSGMTPSQVHARSGALKADDIRQCVAAYVPDAALLRNPDVSPLYALLGGLPPALFTVGTLDAFLDDSLFMYCRWLAAGNQAMIALWPGADHAFTDMPHPLAAPASRRIDEFLGQCLE
jgi:acetyl esterase/lipase